MDWVALLFYSLRVCEGKACVVLISQGFNQALAVFGRCCVTGRSFAAKNP